jgi:hypothetical protein
MARNRYSQPSTLSDLTNGNGDEEKKKSKKELTHRALASKPNTTKVISSRDNKPPRAAEFDHQGKFVKYVPLGDERLRHMALTEKSRMESTTHGGEAWLAEGEKFWWDTYLADD